MTHDSMTEHANRKVGKARARLEEALLASLYSEEQKVAASYKINLVRIRGMSAGSPHAKYAPTLKQFIENPVNAYLRLCRSTCSSPSSYDITN
jgi:hypothetical protein